MAEIVMVGGGVVGLTAGMLLAGDGHRVTQLERDDAGPPAGTGEAWEGWERKGVNQFRLLHFFLPRFRSIVESELPELARAFDEAGALRFNPIAMVPESVSGGFRQGDEAYESLTGRRPVMEAALARVAAETPGLEVRRGVAVAGLLTGTETTPGTPHVVGVRTEDGEEIRADLVVDAGGRRSALPRWLDAIGARPCDETIEDCGFVYYGRHFRSQDGSIPPMMAPLLSDYGSVSVLTLPADNGTWGVGIITVSGDAAMRGLRDTERWEKALKLFPLVAHWGDGEPIDDEIAAMAKIEDRIRRYVVDGAPVATGVVPVADAWACTNPSLGRGMSIGLVHAVALRDLLRRSSPDDATAFALAWDQVTQETVLPWYTGTLDYDRHRLAEAQAAAAGESYEPGDPTWEMTRALQSAAGKDPEVFRASFDVIGVLRLPGEVLADAAIAEKVVTLGAGWRDEPVLGPSRHELVNVLSG